MPVESPPVIFNPDDHSYVWEPTGQASRWSVSSVCNTKTPAEVAAIERYRHVWEPRGTHVHLCLENFLKGRSVDPGDYNEFVEPLLALPFWNDFVLVAAEHRMMDLKRAVGGTLDAIGYWQDQLVLLDLKTGSAPRWYSTNRQLGAYLCMFNQHHGLMVQNCTTIWAFPGKAFHGDWRKAGNGPWQNPTQCAIEWFDAWDDFNVF